jgi:hypothetical protein
MSVTYDLEAILNDQFASEIRVHGRVIGRGQFTKYARRLDSGPTDVLVNAPKLIVTPALGRAIHEHAVLEINGESFEIVDRESNHDSVVLNLSER